MKAVIPREPYRPGLTINPPSFHIHFPLAVFWRARKCWTDKNRIIHRRLEVRILGMNDLPVVAWKWAWNIAQGLPVVGTLTLRIWNQKAITNRLQLVPPGGENDIKGGALVSSNQSYLCFCRRSPLIVPSRQDLLLAGFSTRGLAIAGEQWRLLAPRSPWSGLHSPLLLPSSPPVTQRKCKVCTTDGSIQELWTVNACLFISREPYTLNSCDNYFKINK